MVGLDTKLDTLKVICCPTFAQITSGEASLSHSISWLPPNFFSLFFSKKVGNRYNFNYVDKVDTSFQFIGPSFSNVGLKIASFLANFLQWESLFPYSNPQLVYRNFFDLSLSENSLKIELFPMFRKFLCFLYVLVWHSVLEFTHFRTTITRTV